MKEKKKGKKVKKTEPKITMGKRDRKGNYAFSLREVILLIVVTAGVIGLLTTSVISKRYKDKYETNTYISDKNISNFIEAYETLTKNYYKDVDKKALMNSVITSMMSYFNDPYTTYLDKSQTLNLVESLESEYKGIGVKITKTEEGMKIVEIFEDTPASKAELKVNDVIIKVNDEDITYKPASRVASLIASLNKFKLGYLRDGKELSVEIRTETVDIPSIYTEIFEEGKSKIGYVYVSSFSKNTALQIEKKLETFEENNITGLILDVRSDSGGYLSVAEDAAELFLEKGKLIYGIEDKNGKREILDQTNAKTEIPIVVLINKQSASASEVLAAALKDSYGATIVGETSYGKGKVQQTVNLNDGSMLKYTIADWTRPNGTSIDSVGIIPDYPIELTETEDTQLNKAKELLK